MGLRLTGINKHLKTGVGRCISRMFSRSVGDVSLPLPHKRYLQDSKVERYLRFHIETIDNPSKKLAGVMGEVIADIQGIINNLGEKCYITGQEIISLLNSQRLLLAFDGENAAGFAVSNYFDFKDERGRPEKITLIFANAIRKKYRGWGLMTRLNYGAIARESSGICRFFRPFSVAFRTQSQAVLGASLKYFKGVVPFGLKPETRYQRMIQCVAERMGWIPHLDQNNVLHDVFPDAWSWGEIPIQGLGGHDAYIQAGDTVWTKRILALALLRIYYPVKKWFS